MTTRLKAARSLTYRTERVIEAGESTEATKLAAMTKLFATERVVDITDEALQVYGGAGCVSDHHVERFHYDVRITEDLRRK
jgi:alkylation response protein AidB-like acyl-CoA dehydrogenase